MPLTGIARDGRRVVAPLLDEEQWRLLRQDVRTGCEHITCTTEGHAMYPRVSRRGLAHFAHRGDAHPGEPETGDHLALKALCVRIAHAHGWDAATEVPAADRSWVADVACTRGGRRLVFEVQWSYQGEDEYQRRSQRYLDVGIDVVWLERVRKTSYVSDPAGREVLRIKFWKDTAAEDVYVSGAASVASWIEQVCSGRLAPRSVTEDVLVYLMDCYRCGRTCTSWRMADEPQMWVPDGRRESATDVREIAARVRWQESWPQLAVLARRFSHTLGGEYEAFACPSCNALFGDWFAPQAVRTAAGYDVLRRRPVRDTGRHEWSPSD